MGSIVRARQDVIAVSPEFHGGGSVSTWYGEFETGSDDAARTRLRLAMAGTVGYSGKDEAKRVLAELGMRLPATAP